MLPSPAGLPQPSPPVPLRRQSGEDILRIFVDTDNRDAVGDPVAGLILEFPTALFAIGGAILVPLVRRWSLSKKSRRARMGEGDPCQSGKP